MFTKVAYSITNLYQKVRKCILLNLKFKNATQIA